ncbi:VWA domain-containing protein [candidate division CSSED10-310 bacterium]|uniref:VWA domain-containing protein n=1 Tax=candidate division CSSED10-310 bacterium TaxID=2855610 RepID=A0ABV6YSK1_UNCC1
MTLQRPMKVLLLIFPVVLFCISAACHSAQTISFPDGLNEVESSNSRPLSLLFADSDEQASSNCPPILLAQNKEQNTDPVDSQYSLTIKVELVNLFVTVVDRKGRVVKNLKKNDFSLWEDDVEQNITHFATHKEAALSVAILLDISGSMSIMNKYDNSCRIIRELAQSLKRKDEMALFTFADGIIQVAVPFTQNPHLVTKKLKTLKPYGKTALYWAIDIMPRIIGKPKNRQAIILLTDGIDNLSKISLNQMLDNAKRTRIPIYTLNFTIQSLKNVRPPEEYARISILRTVADHTGGNYFEITSKHELMQALKKMTSELRYQYLLGYHSNQKPKPGSYHKIRLQTLKKKYIVRVRKGYYVSK